MMGGSMTPNRYALGEDINRSRDAVLLFKRMASHFLTKMSWTSLTSAYIKFGKTKTEKRRKSNDKVTLDREQ